MCRLESIRVEVSKITETRKVKIVPDSFIKNGNFVSR